MRGDFSRIRFNPSRHYTSVLEQQGRVSLDADANEQRAIDEYIRDTENTDIIGVFGAPEADAGFAITVDASGIQIGAGRYYVAGILCENEQALAYDSQPYLLNAVASTDLLIALRRGALTAVQVYLEMWQRLVTPLDDPCLREPALGQADTTDRLQTVWRVSAEGIRAKTGDGPGPGGSTGIGRFSTCCTQMYDSITPRQNLGTLSAQTSDQAGDCSCEPTPAAGYRGLENQLYRVEIHKSGDETSATFKWSRENGSIVAAVTGVSGADLSVSSLGPDANLGFQPGQWVEVSDDTFLFGAPPNQEGNLYNIQAITPEQLTITMDQTVAAVDPDRNARVRRWEQFGTSATSNGVPLSAGTWLDLENGIQIQFAPGQFQSGDYWLIPARTASGQIDWPPCDSDGSDFQPPKYTPIYRAPLACIRRGPNEQLTIDDCRRFFVPLTDLAAEPAPPALHVNSISWANDDFLTLDQLYVSGLTITLDTALTGSIDNATFILSLEIPMPLQDRLQNVGSLAEINNQVALLRRPVIVDGSLTIQTTDILWTIPRRQVVTVTSINTLMLPAAQLGEWTRARVRLLGADIFNGSGSNGVFLDGRSFGTPGTRADGTTPRIDLQLPSGNAEKASDFESWFYLAPIASIDSFAVQPPAVKLIFGGPGGFTVVAANDTGNPPTPVTPQGTITLNYPALHDTVISLSIGGGGGNAGVISVPNTATVPRGQTQVQFAVTVISNPGFATQTYQINASLPLAGGFTASNSATFSVTGFEIILKPAVNQLVDEFNLDKITGSVADAKTTPAKTTPASKAVRKKRTKK